LICKCNSFLHAYTKAGDEAHPGPRELSDQGAAPSVGSIGWLMIQRPRIGSVATGCLMSSELVGAELGEPAEQALSAPLWHGRTRPQDTEDGKEDS
jgi:hypothetical protein